MKAILILLGIISLILGIIGIFVPLLPTTPFILLSATLFAKSSVRLNHWLRTNRYFGNIIRDYSENKSISLRSKVTSILLLWVSIVYAIAVVATGKIWLQILLFVIATGVTIHISSYKTKK